MPSTALCLFLVLPAIGGIPFPELIVLRFHGAAAAIPSKDVYRRPGLAQIRANVFFRRFPEFFDQIVLRVMHDHPLPIDEAAKLTAIAAITPPYTMCASGLSHAHFA